VGIRETDRTNSNRIVFVIAEFIAGMTFMAIPSFQVISTS